MKNKITSIVALCSIIIGILFQGGVAEAAKDPFVIVIDAGHGGKDSGTSHEGVHEKTVNLKIALYMEEALLQYHNAEVYLTRYDDTFIELEERSNIAARYGADLMISLHANASSSSSASGAEVYYPNGNYVHNYNTAVSYDQVKNLAQSIQNELVGLGLNDRGIKIRNANDYKYADNTTADYYSLLREPKERGIPSLLIEHGYLSNASDRNNYLSTDAQLKELALANVRAIASNLGLSTLSAEIAITAPIKTEYFVGESLDMTGITVNAQYSDGRNVDLASGEYTMTGFDSSTPGNKVVTISHENATAKFVVCILPQGATPIPDLVGDVNGDGVIKASDYLLIKDSFLEGITLSQVQTNRADVKEDGVIRASDYLMIKDYFMGVLEYLREPEPVPAAEPLVDTLMDMPVADPLQESLEDPLTGESTTGTSGTTGGSTTGTPGTSGDTATGTPGTTGDTTTGTPGTTGDTTTGTPGTTGDTTTGTPGTTGESSTGTSEKNQTGEQKEPEEGTGEEA